MIPREERPIMRVIGRNAEIFFKESGMKKTHFTEAIGWSANTARLDKLFRGEVEVYAGTIQLIAEALGVETMDLFDGLYKKDILR